MLRRVLWSVFVPLCAGLLACGDDEGAPPPLLSVPMVDLSRVNDFVLFGASLGDHLNPAWELRTDTTDLVVVAATAGRVEAVDLNDQGDYEIRAAASGNWLVIYDHILAPVVSVGDELEPGDTLGTIGLWGPSEGRTELQVNHGQVAVCPTSLGTPAFVAAHVSAAGVAAAEQLCLAAEVDP